MRIKPLLIIVASVFSAPIFAGEMATTLVFGDKRYEYVRSDDFITWKDASARAQAMGGQLACLETKEHIEFAHLFRSSLGSTDYLPWLGLTDEVDEGVWRWTCSGNKLSARSQQSLNKGKGADQRDYAYFGHKKKFAARNNSGDEYRFSRVNVPASINAFLVEYPSELVFADEIQNWQDPIDEKYKQKSKRQFSKLLKARALEQSYAGDGAVLTEAYEIAQRIVDKEPEFAPAYQLLAEIYLSRAMINGWTYDQRLLRVAEEYAGKAIELEADYGVALLTLSSIHLRQDKIEKARSAYANASHTDVSTLNLYWGLTRLAKKSWRSSQSRLIYQRIKESVEVGSNAYVDAIDGLRSAYTSKGEYEIANEYYQELLTYRSGRAWTVGNYASFLLFRMRDPNAAIERANEAIKLMDYGMVRTTLAAAHYVKWYELQSSEQEIDQLLAEEHLAYAQAALKYPNSAIKRLKKYEHTRDAALLLEKKLAQWREMDEEGSEERRLRPKESQDMT